MASGRCRASDRANGSDRHTEIRLSDEERELIDEGLASPIASDGEMGEILGTPSRMMVRYRRRAKDDVEQIYNRIASDSVSAAERVEYTIRHAVDMLAMEPELGVDWDIARRGVGQCLSTNTRSSIVSIGSRSTST